MVKFELKDGKGNTSEITRQPPCHSCENNFCGNMYSCEKYNDWVIDRASKGTISFGKEIPSKLRKRVKESEKQWKENHLAKGEGKKQSK